MENLYVYPHKTEKNKTVVHFVIVPLQVKSLQEVEEGQPLAVAMGHKFFTENGEQRTRSHSPRCSAPYPTLLCPQMLELISPGSPSGPGSTTLASIT